MSDDVTRFGKKIADSRANPKYSPGHEIHSDECMSEWGENARGIMTKETISMNHRLHMGDVYSGMLLIGPSKVGAYLHIPVKIGLATGGIQTYGDALCGKKNRASWSLQYVGTKPNLCPDCQSKFEPKS